MPRVTPLGCNGDVATTLPTRRAGRRPDGADALPLPLDFVASDAPPASDATGRGSPPADLDALPPDSILRTFHPAVAGWFLGRFPGGPTEPQRAAWPRIAEGGDVLVASPTGTGKTLTGFLVAIDAAYRAAAGGQAATGTAAGPGVVYVSPLRALAIDVHENLQVPLAGIAREAARRGYTAPDLSVAVRTGDTPAAERAAMRRSPPDLLVTTPESLYLLLTAPSSRAVLRRGPHRDRRRGAHPGPGQAGRPIWPSPSSGSTSWSQPEGGRLQRIGLSATQRPLEVVARLLSGVDPARRPAAIVDCGHRRDLDVAIELPGSELEAVTSGGQLSDVLDRIAEHVLRPPHHADLRQHPQDGRTGGPPAGPAPRPRRPRDGDTRSGDPPPTARPTQSTPPCRWPPITAASRRPVGASSRQRLRAGDLRALVATASLELGIDVGPVELVCQIGSPAGHRHLPPARRAGQPPAATAPRPVGSIR